MAVRGVGADILGMARFRRVMSEDSRAFLERTFTEREREEAERSDDPLSRYASRFAGKEAVFKALEIEDPAFRLTDVEILSAPSGRPRVALRGAARAAAERGGPAEVRLSLSYEDDYAVAFALVQGIGPHE